MHHAIPPEIDAIGQQAIVVGLRVHSALGAGLLEPAYEHCLAHDLALRGIDIRRQVALPIAPPRSSYEFQSPSFQGWSEKNGALASCSWC